MSRYEEVIAECGPTKRAGKPIGKVLGDPSDQIPARFPYVDARAIPTFERVNTTLSIIRDHVLGWGGVRVSEYIDYKKQVSSQKGEECGLSHLKIYQGTEV